MHGGHVELQSFKDGIATIFLSGACSGCAMSTQTLKMGIENMLKYYIPEVLGVEGIEDPNSTVNPYYQRKEMIKWLLKLWKAESGDLSKHRLHTTKYQDLCM